MNNLRLLLKINILHLFNLNALLHEKNKKNKLKLFSFGLLLLFIGVVIVGYSSLYFVGIAPILYQMGALELMLGAMMALASFFIMFTSIYKVVGLVLNCKDYDLLSALPISNKTIMISKWFMLYSMNFILTILIMIPAIIVYAQYVSVGLLFYLLALIFAFLLPLLPLVIGCIIGIIIQYIASFFKSTSIITILLTFLFVLAVLYVSFSAQSEQDFINIATTITNMLNQIYPLTGIFIQALAHSNIMYAALFIAINIVVFTLFILVVSKKYQALNGLVKKHNTVTNYQLEQTKSSTVFMTLVKKELKRYFSSSIYVTNTAMGVVLQTIGVIFLAIKGSEGIAMMLNSIASIPELNTLLIGILPLFICATLGISSTTSTSISIEGQQLWILKSLPINTIDIFKAKMAVNFIIALPLSMINIAILSYFFKLSLINILFTIILVLVFITFISMFGLIVNLNFPVFDWTNEVQVVKQSVSSFISVFGGMATFLIPGYFYIKFASMYVLYGYLFVLIMAVCLGYLYLKTAGTKIFRNL